jgi:hypothetical protein
MFSPAGDDEAADEPTTTNGGDPEAAPEGSTVSPLLNGYRSVHLKLFEITPTRERYAGYGIDRDDSPVLLLVGVPIPRRPEATSPIGCQYKLTLWPLQPLDDVVDVKILHDRHEGEWDIVLP